MDRDQIDTDGQQRRRLADLVRRLRGPQARVRGARTSQSPQTNALTSFGMVIGLLLVWAMAVSM